MAKGKKGKVNAPKTASKRNGAATTRRKTKAARPKAAVAATTAPAASAQDEGFFASFLRMFSTAPPGKK